MEKIELIKKSAQISNSCIPLIKKLLKRKITEKQLAIEIKKKILAQGAKLAFPTLVASGKRASKIHANPTKKEITGLGYVDFGASYKGYKTDLTLSFVKGKITKQQEEILKATLQAYKIAKKEVKVNKNAGKLMKKLTTF